IVNRAITDWKAVIQSFNYAAGPDEFTLEVHAAQLAGRGRTWDVEYEPVSNKPMAAKITLDLDGGGAGWFFDESPLDDAEFTAIGDVKCFIHSETLRPVNK